MSRKKNPYPEPTLVLDKKTGYYNIAWTCPVRGYTKKKVTGTKDKNKAEGLRRAFAVELHSPPPPTESYTAGDLLRAYEAHQYGHDGKGGEAATDAAKHALKPLKAFFAAFTPDQLVDSAWSAYRRWRTQEPVRNASAQYAPRSVKDSTAVKELQIMRAAIKWAKRDPRWKGLSHVEVTLKKLPQTAKHDYLTKREVTSLLNVGTRSYGTRPDGQKILTGDFLHQRLFIRLAVATGARMSALCELTWDRVTWPSSVVVDDQTITNHPDDEHTDPETGWTYYRGGTDFQLMMEGGIKIDLGIGRGNKRRGTGVISLDNMALYHDLKDAYDRRESDYVIEWKGKGVSKVDLSDAYRRAGITKKRQVHILKHTCCTWLVQAGVSFQAIGKLVGTSAKVIEDHYGHHSPEHLQTAARALTLA